MHAILRRAALAGFATSFLLAGAACAAELHVVSSGGGLAALKALAPEFERETGHHLVIDFAPSMGTTARAVPQRIARGEDLDTVLMVGYALDRLVQDGKVADPADVFVSKIGVAVQKGAPVPDTSTVDGLRKAMLEARTIAVSDSASGVYIQRDMLKKLGIEDQVRSKIKVVQADPVGETVAKGDADLGFQQISELKPVHGITLLGPIPDAVQEATLYKAGVVASSHQKEAARDLVRFLTSPKAAAVLEQSGLEPVAAQP